jgi:hypothetical protein
VGRRPRRWLLGCLLVLGDVVGPRALVLRAPVVGVLVLGVLVVGVLVLGVLVRLGLLLGLPAAPRDPDVTEGLHALADPVGERLHLPGSHRQRGTLARLEEPAPHLVGEPRQLGRTVQELRPGLQQLTWTSCAPTGGHPAQHHCELHLLGPSEEVAARDTKCYSRSTLHWISSIGYWALDRSAISAER